MKFIKVTEANEKNTIMKLNADHIISIMVGKSGKDTFIRMAANTPNKDGLFKADYYFVRETMDEIEEMLK